MGVQETKRDPVPEGLRYEVHVLLVVADNEEIDARLDCGQSGPLRGIPTRDGSHVQIVADENPGKTQVVTQEPGEDRRREGSRELGIQRRVEDVGGHGTGDPGLESGAKGHQI